MRGEGAQKATKITKVCVHPLFKRADRLSYEVIGAAIEVHRVLGPGLIESVYERCLLHELALRGISAVTQKTIRIEYKGMVCEDQLRSDMLVEDCLLVENKCAEQVAPIHRAKLVTYMRLLDAPLGLLINYHEVVLKNGIARMILPGANLP